MDDNAKQVSSYQLDQEILDARGIKMSVSEVATLPTCRYAERVAALRLPDPDLAFLKGLRRRIKNRLASQNSRRRSMEHLRRLSRELRVVRARHADAVTDRRALLLERDHARARCHSLRQHIAGVLKSRSDPTEVPNVDLLRTESQPKENPKKVAVTKTETPLLADCFKDAMIERDKQIFECRIDRIVQNSVNHIYRGDRDKTIFARTVFISNEKYRSEREDLEEDLKGLEEDGVLNLSVKEKRRSHGRKQSAPRRIAYTCIDAIENDDDVLDLKIKKEPQ